MFTSGTRIPQIPLACYNYSFLWYCTIFQNFVEVVIITYIMHPILRNLSSFQNSSHFSHENCLKIIFIFISFFLHKNHQLKSCISELCLKLWLKIDVGTISIKFLVNSCSSVKDSLINILYFVDLIYPHFLSSTKISIANLL